MIEAVIFDMDGVLIDSEPIWHEAEIAVFARAGVRLTRQDCIRTQGLRVDEVVDYWHRQTPWRAPSRAEVAQGIVQAVIEGVNARGEPMEGVGHALDFFRKMDVKIALASSSAYALIDAVVDTLGIRSRFDVIHSAQEEPFGKPHPGVYLTTADKLGIKPDRCLAIEDSIHGVISARAARMTCIAIPERSARYDRRYGVADALIDSLLQIDLPLWEALSEHP
jgi:sugar-phosphatase